MHSDKEIRAWANLGQNFLFVFSAPSPPSSTLTPSLEDASDQGLLLYERKEMVWPYPTLKSKCQWGSTSNNHNYHSLSVCYILNIMRDTILGLEPSVRYGLHFMNVKTEVWWVKQLDQEHAAGLKAHLWHWGWRRSGFIGVESLGYV